MTFPLLLYHLTALLSIAVVVFALSKWRRPRSLYFICYALSIAVYAVGYLLEVTAPSLDAAIVACRVQYFGIPYVPVFYYLFSRAYCDRPLKGRWQVGLLLAFPLVQTVLVESWPWLDWFYKGLSFTTEGFVPHLVVSPGPLYRVAQVFNIAIMLLGCAHIVVYFLRGGQSTRRHLMVFLLATAIPFAAYIADVFFFSSDPMPVALTLNSAIMGWYLIRYRQPEWRRLGREAVMEQMKDCFIMMDLDGGFMDANRSAYDTFPALRGLAPGVPLSSLDDFPPQLLMGEDSDIDFTLQADGETLYMHASRTPLAIDGQAYGTSLLIYDDSETRHLVEELQQLATHDALTGLYNRGTFFQYAARDFDLACRKHNDGSVLMMDIDHFKLVNDEYGHQAGDKVLVAIAEILQARLRHTDIAGRYGGEELAVWLPDAAAEGAAIIADVIRRAVEHTVYESDGQRFSVTISIGVAGLDHTRHDNLDALVSEADEALYQAKRDGRNRVCTYAPKIGSLLK